MTADRPDARPPDDDDPLISEEAAAAAAEAASIGGPRPDYDVDDDRRDESWRPLEEAGEGEAEGFELAERDLIEEASHGDERRSPEVDSFTPERESDEATAVYGEPDEVDPTEVVSDPAEDEDDPGAGPGVAADR
ncbi:MAG: hypothetical protein QOD71_2770 [Thermoleophilaceae bacterium]|jgi:hypothetical protein|nr:hypothetical protein [Thermoleophilaceae bacterium]